MPPWASVSPDLFLTGFGIAELSGATVFVGLISFHMLRKVLRAAGL